VSRNGLHWIYIGLWRVAAHGKDYPHFQNLPPELPLRDNMCTSGLRTNTNPVGSGQLGYFYIVHHVVIPIENRNHFLRQKLLSLRSLLAQRGSLEKQPS
jgi:hypothetical protein